MRSLWLVLACHCVRRERRARLGFPMCCPGPGSSRGPKAKRGILFESAAFTKSNLTSVSVAAAHFFDKSLKFLNFTICEISFTTLGLKRGKALPGSLVCQLDQRRLQFGGRGGGT